MSVEGNAQPMAPEKTKGRWRSLIAMAFAFVIDNTEGGLINSLFPVIRDALGLSLTSLGVFTSISRFARMIFGTFWAMMADKYGRKKILVFITGVWGIWTALAGLAQNYTQLLILYALGAIGTVASEPIANAMLSDMFASKERGKAFGAIRAFAGFGGVLLTPVIGQLSKVEDGWRIGLFIMGGLSILSGIIIYFFVTEPERGGSEASAAGKTKVDADFELSKIPELLKNRTILMLIPSQILVTSLVVFSFAVTYLVDVRGFHTADANIVFAVFALGFTISSLIGGFLGDWFERKNPRSGRIILMQLYLVAFAIVSYLAMQVAWPSDAGYYATWFVWGFIGSFGFSGVVLPMISAVTLPEMRSTAFSLLQALLQGFKAAVVSLLVGYLADHFGLPPVMFWVVTVCYALNAILWFAFYKIYPQDVENLKNTLAERAAGS